MTIPGAKLLDQVRSNRVVRFFYPKEMPGDVVSEIYVQSFKWTFFTTFVIGYFFYFFFHADSVFVQNFMDFLGQVLAAITPREYEKVSHSNVNGFFFLIFIAYATVFFFRSMKRIPPDVCDIGKDLMLMTGTFLFFFPVAFLIIQTGEMFEAHPNFNLANFVFLVFFSYFYGFMSVNFVRFLLAVSVLGGWRLTHKSIFNPNRKPYSSKRREK